jgi:hypothetical protein
MDFLDQSFNNAKPVKKKDVNRIKLKEAIKNFIRKHYGKGLPIIRRKLSP